MISKGLRCPVIKESVEDVKLAIFYFFTHQKSQLRRREVKDRRIRFSWIGSLHFFPKWLTDRTTVPLVGLTVLLSLLSYPPIFTPPLLHLFIIPLSVMPEKTRRKCNDERRSQSWLPVDGGRRGIGRGWQLFSLQGIILYNFGFTVESMERDTNWSRYVDILAWKYTLKINVSFLKVKVACITA